MSRRLTPLALGGLLLLPGCGRKPAPPRTAEAQLPEAEAPAPWTWHALGNLVVIEGEVQEETDLALESRSFRESRHAEFGPVRWELIRPPEGEPVQLRDASGRVLARFDFRNPPPPVPAPKPAPRLVARAAPVAPPSAPPALRPPAPAKPAPAPELPAVRLPEAWSPPVPRTARLAPPPVPAAPEPRQPEVQLPDLRMPGAPGGARRTARLDLAPPRPPSVQPAPAEPLPDLGGPAFFPGSGEALNLTRGPRGGRRMLLSFDGGSSAEVATEVLDALRARGLRTTIFLTGAFIQKFPALVRRMAAEGHEIGNHTMNHPHFAPNMRRDPAWGRERVQRELREADAAFQRVAGRPMDPIWRAPYGEQTAEIRRWAEELGFRHVGWSEGADTLDWATPAQRRLYRTGAAILERLHGKLQKDGDGLIVLMHLGSERPEKDRPAAQLGAFLDRALQEGWRFATAGEFLRDLGKPAWDRRRLARATPPETNIAGR